MAINLQNPDFLDLKKRIRENARNFVIVCGAGLSRPAGVPDWRQLRDRLIEACVNKLDDFDPSDRQSEIRKIDKIKENGNLWHAFSALRIRLTDPTYTALVREQLSTEGKECPVIYELLWELGVKGIINFNLDSFAEDAYIKLRKKKIDLATAIEPSKFLGFMSGKYDFLFHPHGITLDPSSWVFTVKERRDVLDAEHYKRFMTGLFQTTDLLILGFNPDDFAFSFLLQIARGHHKAHGPRIYYLANVDQASIQGFSEEGITAIPYLPDDQIKHLEVVDAIKDILDFTPIDETPPTVFRGDSGNPDQLPVDDELFKQPVEQVRSALNASIAAIIPTGRTPTLDDVEALQNFYKEYERSIYNAWLCNVEKFSKINGYELKELRGQGAFGQVFEANSPTGERVAIKVMRWDITNSRDQLTSFRRGVWSMRILTESQVRNMVGFIDAFEVPASIVMEFVDGPTMKEARESGYLNSFEIAISLLIQVGEIVKSAHDLEQRVLHRDLKPENIILRNGYSSDTPPEAVVLDFDLSWHKGASELSVAHHTRPHGYAAPEQRRLTPRKGESTRSTAVDVFGFGMLGFFLFTGNAPSENEHRFANYREHIETRIDRNFYSELKSIPNYLAETVCLCTRDEQKDRISLATAIERLRVVESVMRRDQFDITNPLVLREIASRLDKSARIDFEDFERKLSLTFVDSSKSVELFLLSFRLQPAIGIKLTKSRGEADNRNLTKYLPQAKDRAMKVIKTIAGITNVKAELRQSEIEIEFEWFPGHHVSLNQIDDLVNKLIDTISQVSLTHP